MARRRTPHFFQKSGDAVDLRGRFRFLRKPFSLRIPQSPRPVDSVNLLIRFTMPPKTPLTISQIAEVVGRLQCGESPPEIGRIMGIPYCRIYHIKQGRADKKIIRYLKIENGLDPASAGRGFEVRDTVNSSVTICACCLGVPSDPK